MMMLQHILALRELAIYFWLKPRDVHHHYCGLNGRTITHVIFKKETIVFDP